MSYNFVRANDSYLRNDTVGASAKPVTISGWFRQTAVTGIQAGVYCGDPTTTTTRIALGRTGGTLRVMDRGGTASVTADHGTALPAAGTWYHAVGIYNSATSRTPYLDGSAGTEVTTDCGTQVAYTRTSMGRMDQDSFQDAFDGDIAEVALWDVVLSAGDIAALAAGDSPLSLATEPVRYWRLKANGDLTDLIASEVLTVSAATWSSAHPTVDDPPGLGAGVLLIDEPFTYSNGAAGGGSDVTGGNWLSPIWSGQNPMAISSNKLVQGGAAGWDDCYSKSAWAQRFAEYIWRDVTMPDGTNQLLCSWCVDGSKVGGSAPDFYTLNFRPGTSVNVEKWTAGVASGKIITGITSPSSGLDWLIRFDSNGDISLYNSPAGTNSWTQRGSTWNDTSPWAAGRLGFETNAATVAVAGVEVRRLSTETPVLPQVDAPEKLWVPRSTLRW